MKLFWFLVLSINLVLFQNADAQRHSEIGAFGGVSYYLGDINRSQQFYRPLPSIGVLYHLVLDDRQAFRANVIYGQFQGVDRDFNNAYQQNRNISFSASLINLNVIYEFNFLSFHFNERARTFSPFLFAGLAYNFILQSPGNNHNHLSVPFGTGIKYMISKKTTVGVEWSLQKTFVDNIDGVVSPGEAQYKSPIINNDWYSFAGFFISFRLFDNSDCPVYR